MNALKEIVEYCLQIEPAGALLVTGEWGCGKTYLIEHDLKSALEGERVVLRISLFGVDSLDKIHESVREEWFREYCKSKGIENFVENIRKVKNYVSRLGFLSDFVKGIAGTNWLNLIEVKEKIDGKPIVLVFDDLERCCLKSMDVLGVMNDYCENQKINVIIVANQDKMQKQDMQGRLEGTIFLKDSGFEKKQVNQINFEMSYPFQIEQDEFSYQEIKEKIIQRTVRYEPNFEDIVHAVITGVKFEKSDAKANEYKQFLFEHELDLLGLLVPKAEIQEKVSKERTEEQNSEILEETSPLCQMDGLHNIRSLKCVVQDFYRVYDVLTEKEFTNIEKWLCSFAAYMISYKAGFLEVEESRYGTIFMDAVVSKYFPIYQDQFMFDFVKQWILHGIWNEEAMEHEIQIRQERERARTPEEIIRSYPIIDVDDNIVDEGFQSVLSWAYEGKLNVNEYVLFIENCYLLRKYKPNLSKQVEWNKVTSGINICIENLMDNPSDDQYMSPLMNDKIRNDFNQNEEKAFQIIEKFIKGEILLFSKNRNVYIEEMKKDFYSAFAKTQHKRFNVFDEEMAEVTAHAFDNSNNVDKDAFVSQFKNMWEGVIKICNLDIEQTHNGLTRLKFLLQKQKEKLDVHQTFAILHTKNFIEAIDDLLTQLQNPESYS